MIKKTYKSFPITEELHKKLLDYVNENINKENIHNNLLCAYTILYHSGIRVIELLSINNRDIINAIATGNLLITDVKTEEKRELLISKNGVLDFKKLFINIDVEDADMKVFNVTEEQLKRFLGYHIKKGLGEQYSAYGYLKTTTIRRGV